MNMPARPERAQKPIATTLALVASMALIAAACSSDGTEEIAVDAEPTAVAVETTASTEADVPADASATTPETTTAATSEAGDAFDAVDAYVETVLADQGLEGAGLIVVDADGALHHQHYGTFTVDRVSPIASSAKMISAGVLLRLQEEGVLDINAPLTDVTDSAADNPDMTVAQLLSNSSGLVSDNSFEPYFCQFAGPDLTGCTTAILSTPDDDAEVIAPDTAFRYGGAQWQVAGGIAEIASGESWAELIERIYTEPCGLETLRYGGGEVFSDFPAPPSWFDGNAASVPETMNPNIEGGGYINTTDYGALLQMQLNGGECPNGQVFSQESIDTMHADRIGEAFGGVTPETGLGYGMGWWQIGNGLINDPGAFGALAWISTDADYAAYWVIEDSFLTTLEISPALLELVHQAVTGESLSQQ